MSQENTTPETPQEGTTPKSRKMPQMPKFNAYWIYGVIIVIFLGMQFFPTGFAAKDITWQQFDREMLRSNDVEKLIVVNKTKAEVFIKADRLKSPKYEKLFGQKFAKDAPRGPHFTFQIGSVEIFDKQLSEAQKTFGEQDQIPVTYEERKDYFSDIIGWLLLPAIFIIFWLFMMKRMGGGSGAGGGGGIFNVGKSRAVMFDKDSHVRTNFGDVAGLEEAKTELKEIVDFLKKPQKYTDLGGKIPKGALLVGPPGTGKTLLAKAVAGEANVPFFSLSGSDFVEMFVGVGASRVRDLFKQAKEKAPCIIFIDEIDAIGRARGKNANFGSNDERENTLNQLLTEMDGFATNAGVIILAATNRADILDRALLRAGRFDRQIFVDLPDLNERLEIFKVHLRPLKLAAELDIDFLAKQTPGFSGADIANVCNEAALIAARKEKKIVEKQDFLDAVDRIVGGLEKKNKIVTVQERRTIAFHEAGHASVSWLLEHANPLVKVTIVPRGRALGAAWYLPEERQITTREQMLDEMCSTLGGRASEEIFFDMISTGALNDLERVTRQSYAMVSYFGMSDKVGNMSYYDSSGQNEYGFTKPYSEKTAQTIDEEAALIIAEQYERAKQIIKDNRPKLEELAAMLLEREVIFTEDVERIFGKRIKTIAAEEEAERLKVIADAKVLADENASTEINLEKNEEAADTGTDA